MAFNQNIPQPGDLISVSQGDLLNNNAAIAAQFAPDLGLHILNTEADPATSATQLALYAKNAAAVLNFLIRQPSSGSIVQMTAYNPSANLGGGGTGINLLTTANTGTSFIPSLAAATLAPNGILIQFGRNATTNVVFPIKFAPTGGTAFLPIVIACPNTSLGNMNSASTSPVPFVQTVTNTGFTMVAPQGQPFGVNWLAIGPA